MKQEWCLRPRVHWEGRGGYILVDFPQVSCPLHPDTRPPRWSPEAALPPTPRPITSLAMPVTSAVGTSVTNSLWKSWLCQLIHGRNKHELCPGVLMVRLSCNPMTFYILLPAFITVSTKQAQNLQSIKGQTQFSLPRRWKDSDHQGHIQRSSQDEGFWGRRSAWIGWQLIICI
jgi:hypothetical protein